MVYVSVKYRVLAVFADLKPYKGRFRMQVIVSIESYSFNCKATPI